MTLNEHIIYLCALGAVFLMMLLIASRWWANRKKLVCAEAEIEMQLYQRGNENALRQVAENMIEQQATELVRLRSELSSTESKLAAATRQYPNGPVREADAMFFVERDMMQDCYRVRLDVTSFALERRMNTFDMRDAVPSHSHIDELITMMCREVIETLRDRILSARTKMKLVEQMRTIS